MVRPITAQSKNTLRAFGVIVDFYYFCNIRSTADGRPGYSSVKKMKTEAASLINGALPKKADYSD